MESTPGEDAMKIVETTIKNLEYYVKLSWCSSSRVWEDWLQFWKFCGYSAVNQHCLLQRNRSWKEESMDEAHFTVVLF